MIELHSHLHGSASLSLIQTLIKERLQSNNLIEEKKCKFENFLRKLCKFTNREKLNLSDCFDYFDVIHDCIDTKDALSRIVNDVLTNYQSNDCIYLELRTTPRIFDGLTELDYIRHICKEIDSFKIKENFFVRLIISIDRSKCSTVQNVDRFMENYETLSKETKKIIGIDISGNPTIPLPGEIISRIKYHKNKLAFPLTLHIGEVNDEMIMSNDFNIYKHLKPERLGHALYIQPSLWSLIEEDLSTGNCFIEICPTSNLVTTNSSKHPTISKLLSLEHYHKRLFFNVNCDDCGLFNTDIKTESNHRTLPLSMRDPKYQKIRTLSTINHVFDESIRSKLNEIVQKAN
ncbi:hypothetical protein SNEBB_008917 [Seison nebaliae]|nr:hypothetical protein SNEBB_008917 [Seison nebaliae]